MNSKSTKTKVELQTTETVKCAPKITKMKANSVQAQPTLEDFKTSNENPIPVFLEKAIHFIEREGLDAEGLYRVPGNRAHVDLLFQKYDEGNLIF